MTAWTAVEDCLGMTSAMPKVVVIDGSFTIGSISPAKDDNVNGMCDYGCGVYLKLSALDAGSYVAAHEFVHWISGDRTHGELMQACGKIQSSETFTF